MLCSFLICADYAIIRPVSNSLFITQYAARIFPYAWLGIVPLNLCLVCLYNKYLPRWGCWRVFLTFALLVLLLNTLAALFVDRLSFFPFLFYLWKEVYIMLMFQLLWSVIHQVTSLKRAKYLYGILFGVGSAGGICGSSLPSFFATQVGSQHLLFATLPLYGLLILAYWWMLRQTRDIDLAMVSAQQRGGVASFFHGVQLIMRSKLLTLILILVVCMQISSTLIDYQFNLYLGRTIEDTDLRTACVGKVLGFVHMATLCLQFVGAFALVHFLGLKNSHFFIPCVLAVALGCFISFPLFSVIGLSYVLIKSFDFSLFGVLREMLYVSLSREEKFQAKAVIDVFAYRSAKGVASLLILVLQFVFGLYFESSLPWATMVVFALWAFSVVVLFKDAQQSTNSLRSNPE